MRYKRSTMDVQKRGDISGRRGGNLGRLYGERKLWFQLGQLR